VQAALQQAGGPAIPHNFAMTAPPYDPASGQRRGNMPRMDLRNPQTEALLAMIGLQYDLDGAGQGNYLAQQYTPGTGVCVCTCACVCV
jgi:hypothetical protein